jgi:hypothetical protein
MLTLTISIYNGAYWEEEFPSLQSLMYYLANMSTKNVTYIAMSDKHDIETVILNTNKEVTQ